MAFNHCNNFISGKLGSDISATFPSVPANAWSLGNYEYIINADMELVGKDNPSQTSHHYVCRVQYDNGDDTSGAANFENWSIKGIEGLPNL